jgi:hypothetical protein
MPVFNNMTCCGRGDCPCSEFRSSYSSKQELGWLTTEDKTANGEIRNERGTKN